MTKIVKPKNTLKEKVGDGGFNPESIKRAQTTIEENVVDFKPIATHYLGEIKKALSDEKTRANPEVLYGQLLDQLTQLRAQGAMFQYPAITLLTDTVVDLLDSLKSVDKTILEIIHAYEQSAMILLAKGIKSDQDKTCQILSKELNMVCSKYKEKKQG
ncbi:MAG: hypothetical protein ACLFR0_08980 [Alphaproteobacteria bacterium]